MYTLVGEDRPKEKKEVIWDPPENKASAGFVGMSGPLPFLCLPPHS